MRRYTPTFFMAHLRPSSHPYPYGRRQSQYALQAASCSAVGPAVAAGDAYASSGRHPVGAAGGLRRRRSGVGRGPTRQSFSEGLRRAKLRSSARLASS